MKATLKGLLAVILLLGAGYLIARYVDHREQEKVEASELDSIVTALRQPRNRLQVYGISGSVFTKREVRGGPGSVLRGEMKVRQPWSVNYYVDMGQLGLDDYIWDERTRTLLVRAPAAQPEAPNIDESRQVVAYDGFIITRDMQTRLRSEIATGARQQATQEARKPENLIAADEAAKAAIARNLKAPLQVAGIKDVSIVVRAPTEGVRNAERWDLSRTIAEVLAERSGR